MKVNKYVNGAVRQFSLWFAKGTLGYPLLEGIDYTDKVLKEEISFVEQAFAIFMNNLEVDEQVGVTYCESRVAQYIREYFDSAYTASPPIEEWECELYPVSQKYYNK